MELYVGMDVSLKETSICVVDGSGKIVTEIAGRASPLHLLRLAAARPRPPCNAGEVQHQRWLEKWLKSYRPPVPLYDF